MSALLPDTMADDEVVETRARYDRATTIRTRPPLHRRVWRFIRAAWLRQCIKWLEDDTEAYSREGRLGPKTAELWRKQLQALRCELIAVEAES